MAQSLRARPNACVTGNGGQSEQTAEERKQASQRDHADTLCTFGLPYVKK